MRLSYLWIKSLVNLTVTPSELAEVLTMVGLEVENLEPVGPDLEGIIVGQVLEVKPHPNASKLTLCTVDLGDRETEVVCGAPNVRAGQKVPFIGAGLSLPNGMLIESRSIRGIVSEGMICSGVEIGINEDADGILVLDSDTLVGSALHDVIGPRDWALDVEVTINRPDCLSHLGVAREAAAGLGIDFQLPQYTVKETGPPIAELTSIFVEESELCPRYSARVIRGVKIGPSPDWMRRRLEAVGLRAINNVVDVTNYVMLEMGHPMHAFDLHQLAEKRIVVKRAKNGEKFTTLDEQERRLDDRMLLICDAEKGVALAGVMGGENSEISESTQDLLLESAYFDPINTRRTSKALGLSTDSSRRFERGADPNATIKALDMAAVLITDLAGGEVAAGVVDVYPHPITPKEIQLRPSRVNAILGVEVSKKDMRNYLLRLGCEVSNSDPLQVKAPTFRPDLEREIDLIEEVARQHGYDKVPSLDRAYISLSATSSDLEVFRCKLRDTLVKLGFTQVMTSPLISSSEAALPGMPESVRLRNPESEDTACLCNGLLPGILKAAAHNLNREQPDLRIFEISRGFTANDAKGNEWESVAGLLVGKNQPGYWDNPLKSVDFLDVKGAVEILLREIGLDKPDIFYYNIGEPGPFTADAMVFRSYEGTAGRFGQIHPEVARKFEIGVPVYYFEFNISDLEKIATKRVQYKSFPKYPPLQRDLAFVLVEDVAAGKILDRIQKIGGEQLVRCELFDVYYGSQVGKGKKSIGIRLSFQSPSRTLTDAEADDHIRTIIRAVETEFGGSLRS